MVPRQHRLSDRHEIQRVFRSGKKAYGSLFSFVFLPNTLGTTRFTVIVSKKVFPHAVNRNHLKRLVRESIRPLLPTFAAGFDGIFFALKTPVKKPPLTDIAADIKSILRKTHLLS